MHRSLSRRTRVVRLRLRRSFKRSEQLRVLRKRLLAGGQLHRRGLHLLRRELVRGNVRQHFMGSAQLRSVWDGLSSRDRLRGRRMQRVLLGW